MPNFGQKSMACLSTCHPKLMRIAYEVIKDYDHSIIWGHRNEVEQTKAFDNGDSFAPWPQSDHNKLPSVALDAIPYPKQWTASDRDFVELAARYIRAAKKLGIKLHWGGFFLPNGKHFFDGAHLYLDRSEYT